MFTMIERWLAFLIVDRGILHPSLHGGVPFFRILISPPVHLRHRSCLRPHSFISMAFCLTCQGLFPGIYFSGKESQWKNLYMKDSLYHSQRIYATHTDRHLRFLT